jgi:hypothetical protein
MTFKEQIEKYLSVLPSEWKDKLTSILCEIQEGSAVDCDKVKECETLTSLSQFSVQGSTVSITYKDENSTSYSRSFDVAQILNSELDELDAACLTDATTWSNLSYAERIQLLINKHCDCCS